MDVPSPFLPDPNYTVIASQASARDWTDQALDVADQEAFSLIFVFKTLSRKVLLGTKKRGYGTGLIHGFGGKLEPGETIKQCALRELQEESGIAVYDDQLQRKGRLIFTRPGGPTQRRKVIDIALFVVDQWQGEPIETEEMAPSWYDVDDLPLDGMWPDVRLYFPALLKLVDREAPAAQLLARVDYDYLSCSPLARDDLPSLRTIGLARPSLGEAMEHADKGIDEGIVGYWLAYQSTP